MNADHGPLLQAAEQALASAHAPYSGLRVGAAVRSASGQLHLGCNVENAAFPLGSCAEANAIAAAVLAEGARLEITDIAIAARDAAGARADVSPCGGCRQRILEFGARTTVHWIDAEARLHSTAIAALLPHSFRLDRDAPDTSGR